MYKILVTLFLISLTFSQIYAGETENLIYTKTVDKPMEAVYDSVYAALESEKFWIVFEANMGKNLAGFAKKWEDNYNQNKLESIRSMVFCNGWYANKVSNLDPTMLAICPLSVTLTQKDGKTTVQFVKPSMLAVGSPAQATLKEVEEIIIGALEKGME